MLRLFVSAVLVLLTFAAPVLARPAPQAVASNFPVYATFTPDDPYYRLCFGGQDPLDGEFRELADSILRPLLERAGEEG